MSSVYATRNLLEQSAARRGAMGGMRDEQYAADQQADNERRQRAIDEFTERIESLTKAQDAINETLEKARLDAKVAADELQKQIQEIIDFALPQLKNPDESAGGPVEQDGQRRQKWGARVPTGTIALTANTVPPGWLECDGTEIRRDENFNLYSVVGERFGAPSGVHVFKLPSAAQLPTLPTPGTRWIIRK